MRFAEPLRSVAVLSAVLVGAALLASCGGDADEPNDAPLTATPDATAPASSVTTRAADDDGCNASTPPPAGTSEAAILSAGIERTYILHVPPGYNGTRAVPLVLNFHGFGSNARQQHNYSRFASLADQEGFIVATPNATGVRQQWNIGPTAVQQADDVAFVSDLLASLGEDLCIDTRRIYAAGISNGSAFAQRLVCDLPQTIAAVGAVAVVTRPLTCDDRPVPLIAFHGTDDACVPYAGGTVTCGPVPVPIAPVEENLAAWARHAGCDGEPSRAEPAASVSTLAYSDCAAGATVVLYRIEGGGHTWPGSIDAPRLGATTREVDATALMWAFFSAHELAP